MVDVGLKDISHRIARACAQVKMTDKTIAILLSKGSPKGDIFETAKIAGIMAAKSTASVIPLCHPLSLEKIGITFDINRSKSVVTVYSQVSCHGRTGVEMEALLAVAAAALTIYDMMKWADKKISITDIKLLYKSGGKSGVFEWKK